MYDLLLIFGKYQNISNITYAIISSTCPFCICYYGFFHILLSLCLWHIKGQSNTRDTCPWPKVSLISEVDCSEQFYPSPTDPCCLSSPVAKGPLLALTLVHFSLSASPICSTQHAPQTINLLPEPEAAGQSPGRFVHSPFTMWVTR